MEKLLYTHTIEYCSAMKRSELMLNAIAWMNVKTIILSKRSQTRKYIIPFTRIYKNIQIYTYRRDERLPLTGEIRRGIGKNFKKWGNVLEWWKVSSSWLCWSFHWPIHTSKYIKFYTVNMCSLFYEQLYLHKLLFKN